MYKLLHYDERVVRTVEQLAPTTPIYSGANASREQNVINAIHHAWRGYAHYALDTDELLPLSKIGQNNWGHLQWTLVDALDTLYLAGLHEDLKQARDHLAKASFAQNSVVSTFEMTIRLLGGTLAAFELTHDPLYLDDAEDIGNRVLGAFGAPSGIPTKTVHMILGHPNVLGKFKERKQSLVGAGSLQLELSHLSYLTKDPKYNNAGRGAIAALQKAHRLANRDGLKLDREKGLFPMTYDVDSGNVTSMGYFTMGSGADSFYEYLLKLYILEGGNDQELLNMYIRAVDDMAKDLVVHFKLSGEPASALTSRIGSYQVKKMDHLSCFVPGMLALGADYGKRNKIPQLLSRYDEHMTIAKQLMRTCVYFYTSQPSGLSAEEYEWTEPISAKTIKAVDDSKDYRLRPETVESLYVPV